MQQSNSTIQYVILGVFILFAVAGVILFAGFAPTATDNSDQRVLVWGLLPSSFVKSVIDDINISAPGTINMDYEEKNSGSFANELANAIAEGTGPDIVIIPQDILITQLKKLTPIPYSYFSERTFKDTFIEAGEIFLSQDGIVAMPFIVDPLVLYWNRDMFGSAGVLNPPKEWNEFTNLVPKLTKSTGDKTITKAGVSFGEFQNVKNAKEIIATLAMQAGSPIVKSEDGELLDASLEGGTGQTNALDSALLFYTQFADPSRDTYSWNKSLPRSDTMFLRNNAGMYIGFASELSLLQSQNPNLNFDVSLIPQASGSERKLTFARVYGAAILSSSPYKSAALKTIGTLISKDVLGAFAGQSFLPPVRKDLLNVVPNSAAKETFYMSAIIGKSWLDPEPSRTSQAFENMIDAVTTGRSGTAEAARTFSREITDILQR